MLMASPSRKPDRADIGIAVALAVLGAAAVLAPATLLQVAPRCLFALLLDMQCWGCGMTRASVALLQGEVAAAWHLNRASLVVLPLLLLLYARHVHRIWRYARRK